MIPYKRGLLGVPFYRYDGIVLSLQYLLIKHAGRIGCTLRELQKKRERDLKLVCECSADEAVGVRRCKLATRRRACSQEALYMTAMVRGACDCVCSRLLAVELQ